jgi:hypothetical protein
MAEVGFGAAVHAHDALRHPPPFQFETKTGSFSENLPFHTVDFATLEIDIDKAPATIRGRFYSRIAFH